MKRDLAGAMQMYEAAALQGNLWSIRALARIHFARASADDAERARNDGEAMRWWTKAAKQNDAEAMASLGFLLEKGRTGRAGAEPHKEAALDQYLRAARLGCDLSLIHI